MENLITNDDKFGVKGVVGLFAEKEEKGIAEILRYEFKEEENIWDGDYFMRMYDGHYCKLIVGNNLVMSDTYMERDTNREFIKKANGRVLIAGLGLGMVLNNILDKKEVSEVLVIELYQDVIDLVSPKFKNKKLTIIQGDIFDWRPAKKEKFDTIYFDIWTGISTDNLEEIKDLHNKFKWFLNRENKNCYMNSWLKEFLQRRKRREKNQFFR